MFDIAFTPEKPGAKDVTWTVLAPSGQSDQPWMFELGEGDQRVAYVRTWIFSDKDQPARFEFGTDDGNKLWLNGKVVHANPAGGAATPGKYKVDVALKQGWNALVMKVLQDTGPWEFCFRIRRPDGSRLDGLKVQALPPGN